MPGGTADDLTRRRLLTVAAASVVGLCACSGDDDSDDEGPPTTDEPFGPPEGFGSDIDIGSLAELRLRLQVERIVYVPDARSYLVAYPRRHIDAAKKVYPVELHAGLDLGVVALYQKCPHLGCRVPPCGTSGLFECPCHHGEFSAVGEWRAGSPTRGMDLFAVSVANERVILHTAEPIDGLPTDIDVTQQRAAGARCVGG